MSVKLSIICPMYKVVEFLPELIDSLIAGANNKEVELIFVDDACPENSAEVCKRYLNTKSSDINFSYQVLILDQNIGQAGARNYALSRVEGDYIGFLDSDDLISKKYWQVLSSQIKTCDQDIIEFGFQEFSGVLPKEEHAKIKSISSSELNPFRTGFFVWTRVFKRALLEGLLFPEGMIFEDIYFTVLAFSKAKEIEFIPECLVFYRKRDGSTTSIRSSSYSQLLENLVKAVHQVISKSSVSNEMMLALSKRCLLVIFKGAKISDIGDRVRFYRNCAPLLKEATDMNLMYSVGFNKFLGGGCILASKIILNAFLLFSRFKK
jgi:glycosyltransferase involved in cell wall biosynthesis